LKKRFLFSRRSWVAKYRKSARHAITCAVEESRVIKPVGDCARDTHAKNASNKNATVPLYAIFIVFIGWRSGLSLKHCLSSHWKKSKSGFLQDFS
jgi:hypothetical protein